MAPGVGACKSDLKNYFVYIKYFNWYITILAFQLVVIHTHTHLYFENIMRIVQELGLSSNKKGDNGAAGPPLFSKQIV